MHTPRLARIASGLADGLFGGTCYLCRGACGAGLLCAPCSADLVRLARPRCPQCALPVAGGTLCGRCLGDPPAYDATQAVFGYAFPVDVLVQGLKFRGELALAPLLAGWLAEEVGPAGAQEVDLVTPVPLHAARLAGRGYNQSVEIARRVAAALDVPFEAGLCERLRATPVQTELPWKARRANVRGAFGCRRALGALRVAVVDDVMTTGATLHEVAVTLKQAGARRVVNWIVARTTID